MFGWMKNWFTSNEQVPWGMNTGETTMTAKIISTGDKFALVDRHNTTIGTYSRKRDAVRGAKRRGFEQVVGA